MKPMILGVARHVLTAAGGAIVARGWLDAGQAEVAIGALIALIGVGWSMVEKRR
jgi:hypothetical protein